MKRNILAVVSFTVIVSSGLTWLAMSILQSKILSDERKKEFSKATADAIELVGVLRELRQANISNATELLESSVDVRLLFLNRMSTNFRGGDMGAVLAVTRNYRNQFPREVFRFQLADEVEHFQQREWAAKAAQEVLNRQ